MTRSTTTERRFAVCVGINSYSALAGLSDLRFAEADAMAMDGLLGGIGFLPEHRRLLLGTQATLTAINAALEETLLDLPRSNDLVVLYFAGHGVPVHIVEDDAQQIRVEVFLASCDFDHTAVKSRVFRHREALGIERLRRDYFEGEGARRRLFLFDGYYSGMFPGPAYRDSTNPINDYIRHRLDTGSKTGRIALGSFLPLEKVVEDPVLGHGRLTYHLLQALRGEVPAAQRSDGAVTIGSLFGYLSDALPVELQPILSGVQSETFELVQFDGGRRSLTPTQILKQRTLRKQMAARTEEYEAVSARINESVDPVEVIRLRRQLKAIETQLLEVDNELRAINDAEVTTDTRPISQPISSEHVNRATLRNAIEQSFSMEEVISLCFDLGLDFENLPGAGKVAKARELIQYMERRGRLADLIAAVRQQRPDIDAAQILGVPHKRQPEIDLQTRLLNQALDLKTTEQALVFLRQLLPVQEEYVEALYLFERGQAAALRTGEEPTAGALAYVGSAFRTRNKSNPARALYEYVLKLRHSLGDISGQANALQVLGGISQELGEMAAAGRYFSESLTLWKHDGSQIDIAESLARLSQYHGQVGDTPRALDCLREAESIWIQLGDQGGQINTCLNIGATLLSAGQIDESYTVYDGVRSFAAGLGRHQDEVRALLALGQIATMTSAWGQAVEHYRDAIARNALADNDHLAAVINLGNAYAGLQQWSEALKVFEHARHRIHQAGDHALEAVVLASQAEVYIRQGQAEAAIQAYQEAIQIRQVLGDMAGATQLQDSINALLHERDEFRRPIDQIASEAQQFFLAAGFTIATTSDPLVFLCQPNTPYWQTKIRSRVSICLICGHPLDGMGVLKIHQAALASGISLAFALVDRPVRDEGWLQIAALRPTGFNTVPLPMSLLHEGKLVGKAGTERTTLAKHMEQSFVRTRNPYDVRDPVSDVLSFFGREMLADDLIERLITGHPIGLFGLRKMGKSSLMRYMQRRMPFPTAWLDLQAGVEPANIWRRALRAWIIDAQTRLTIDLNLDDTPLSTASPSSDFLQRAQVALDTLSEQQPGLHLALFLDEVDLITPPPDAPPEQRRSYLEIMRVLRTMVQEDGRFVLMVAGVDPTVNRLNRWDSEQNPMYQLLQEEFIPPLLETDCAQLVRNIGLQAEITYTDEALRCAVDASGGHPFLARQICSLAYRQRKQQPGEVTETHIVKAIDHFLYDPQYSVLIDGHGMWGEVGNVRVWGAEAAQAGQDILIELAQADAPIPLARLIQGKKVAQHRLVLNTLCQLSVVRATSSAQDPDYMIAFRILHTWLRRIRLGLSP